MKHKAVEASLEKRLPELNLQPIDTWVLKIIQTYEMSLVRHSLMLVGPSGTGKTRVVECLLKTLMACEILETEPPMVGQPHKEMKMNPKVIYAPQMFGFLDMVANEWTEGIFASLWGKANKDKKHFTWLVLDAIWIENMNTVMDDNRILTLANNDRIAMLRLNCTLHFEVEDLRNASPATVSRAGIIYVSLADLGWQPYYVSWLKEIKRPKAEDELLSKLFDKVVTAIFELLLFECSPCMYNTPIVLLTSMHTILYQLLLDAGKENAQLDLAQVERYFLYSLCWTVAGILENKDCAKVDKCLRGLSKVMPDPGEANDTIYEFKVDDSTGDWVHWVTLIPKWEMTPGFTVSGAFASLLIPTVDSTRNDGPLDPAAPLGALHWWPGYGQDEHRAPVPRVPGQECLHGQEDVLLVRDHAHHLPAPDRELGREALGQELWAAGQQGDARLHRRHLDARVQRLGRPDHDGDRAPTHGVQGHVQPRQAGRVQEHPRFDLHRRDAPAGWRQERHLVHGRHERRPVQAPVPRDERDAPLGRLDQPDLRRAAARCCARSCIPTTRTRCRTCGTCRRCSWT